MLKPFRRTQASDPQVRLLQDATEASLKTILDKQIVDGRLIEGVTLVSGDNDIEHKLSRDLRGYLVVRQSASASIYDKQSLVLQPNRFLRLNASTNLTVSLWVF